MRLGLKYEIPPLYDSALHRLLSSFPFSVEKYTAETTILTKLILFNDPQDGRRRREIVIDTILLARELDLPFLLPAAFWFAATNIDSLVEPNTPSISKADRNAILSAAKPLCMAYANYVLGWLDEELPDCSKPVTCRHAKAEYSLKVWKPPGPSLVLYWLSSSSKGLCRSCIAAGKKHFSEGVTRLWNELPSFFKLPSWEELLAGVPNVQGR
jgi:hypothetical protein